MLLGQQPLLVILGSAERAENPDMPQQSASQTGASWAYRTLECSQPCTHALRCERRTLVDDKIGAKDLPKDLQRLATKVIKSEQEVEKTVGKKIEKKVSEGSHDPLGLCLSCPIRTDSTPFKCACLQSH